MTVEMASMLDNGLDGAPKSLGDWVRDFRIKKVAMKRRRNGDLRVAAILTTALAKAETELRRKQNERALRWSEMQSRLLCTENSHFVNQLTSPTLYDGNECNASLYSDDVGETMEKQRKQIDNYWKCELSGLDNFLTSLSSNNNIKRSVES